MKNYKDVYSFPLVEPYLMDWVYDQKENFVFEFLIDDRKMKQKILDVINGKENLENHSSYSHEDGVIQDDKGQEIILIRGWGNLTGKGAMNLSFKVATNIQDTFAEFIIERLNYRGASNKEIK